MPVLIRPGQADFDAIKRESYYLTAFYNGQAYSLGYTDVGALNIVLAPRIVTKEVDQLATTRAKADMLGYEASITATLSGTSVQYLRDFILTQQTAVRGSSTTGGAGYGIGDRGLPVETFELSIVPTSNADGDFTESFVFWSAGLGEGVSLSLAGNKNEFQSIDVEFVAYPNFDETDGFRYGIMGNCAAVGDEPNYVFITSGAAVAPYMHEPAMTLSAGAASNKQAYGMWEAAAGATAAINQVGGITATDTAIPYDTLANGAFAIGDIIGIGTERMYVTNVTSTVLTVVRASCGSVAAIAADNAVITRYSKYFVRVTDLDNCDWASDDLTDVGVGNTAGGTGNNRKGQIYNVSSGSGNVTATVYNDDGVTSTASPALAVTTL